MLAIVVSSSACYLYDHMTFTILNSGSNVLTDVIVEFGPDGTSWEKWDATTFAALSATAPDNIKSLALTGNSRKFLRVEARSASGTTVSGWVDCTNQAY